MTLDVARQEPVATVAAGTGTGLTPQVHEITDGAGRDRFDNHRFGDSEAPADDTL